MNIILVANPTSEEAPTYGYQYWSGSAWVSKALGVIEYISAIDDINASPSTYKINISIYAEEFVEIVSAVSPAISKIRFNSTIDSNVLFAKMLGFIVDTEYSLPVVSPEWGMRLPIETDISNLGTDCKPALPYTIKGGKTLSGKTFRKKTNRVLMLWKCKTTYLTNKQVKYAVKFFEQLGSDMPIIMSNPALAYYGDSFISKNPFQIIADGDYLKNEDTDENSIEFEILERL